MKTISAIINTYNEEENIEECLRCIRWVDEIIVVDMHSTDNTVEISKKYTNKIFYYQKLSFVEPARNYAISKAAKDWILILDADERLPVNAEKVIRYLIKNNQIDGYSFPRKTYIKGDYYLKFGYFYPDYQLRLFRKDRNFRYSNKIHLQVKSNEKVKTKLTNILEITHNLSHCKYDSFFHLSRFIPYISIEGKELSETPIASTWLIFSVIFDPIRHFYRSFIKLEGYKDGYPGLRAALIYSLYKLSVIIVALYYRIRY